MACAADAGFELLLVKVPEVNEDREGGVVDRHFAGDLACCTRGKPHLQDPNCDAAMSRRKSPHGPEPFASETRSPLSLLLKEAGRMETIGEVRDGWLEPSLFWKVSEAEEWRTRVKTTCLRMNRRSSK